MPIYVYETLEESPRRFEAKQGMSEPALTHCPETGVAVRRVISGGYGMIQKSGAPISTGPASSGCGGGCACH